MTEHIDALKTLHTSLIDSRIGYEEALEDADGKGLTPLFREMIALRTRATDELTPYLVALGENVDKEGSFMSTVHRTVISIQSVLTGLDESILPGLIDGENRVLKQYDAAIAQVLPGSSEYAILIKQREDLRIKIDTMQRRNVQAA